MASEHDALAEILERRRNTDHAIVAVETPTVLLVIFAIGDTLFAFSGTQISEILPLTTIYFVPGCPPSLEGVINVRGDIASVIRLGDLLAVDHAPTGRGTAILLGRSAMMHSGLRVDQVLDVLDVLEESIQPAPTTLPGSLRSWTTGIFVYQERSVLLLDLERLFHDYRAGLEGSR